MRSAPGLDADVETAIFACVPEISHVGGKLLDHVEEAEQHLLYPALLGNDFQPYRAQAVISAVAQYNDLLRPLREERPNLSSRCQFEVDVQEMRRFTRHVPIE